MALEVYDSCQKYTIVRDGGEWPNPQHGNALKAIELMARLLGHLGDGRQMTEQQLRSELDRMGYKLVAKEKLRVAEASGTKQGG